MKFLKESEIIEGNELINKFMGGKNLKRDRIKKWVNDTSVSIKGFHEDWNILMEVKDKIISLSIHHHITIHNTHSSVTIYNGGRGNNIMYSETFEYNNSISSTWKAIVEYIKWHDANFDKKFKFIFDKYVLV